MKSTNEIINRVYANGVIKMPFAKTVTKKIIRQYFDSAQKAIIEGYEWEFPSNVGSVVIYKNALMPGELPNVSKVESLKNKYKTLSYNPKTVGYYYSIEMNSDLLKITGMSFKANPTFRKKLFARLYNTDKDYRKK